MTRARHESHQGRPQQARLHHGRRRRALLVSLLCGLLAAALLLLGARNVGYWLMLDQPLLRSRAIVVLGGHIPFRASEAARLYRDGWAPEVWLTHPPLDETEVALEKLGIRSLAEYEVSREVALKMGVPATAIHIVPDAADNTVAEVKAIAHYAEQRRDQPSDLPIIIVTSKFHTRRVRILADRFAPSTIPIVVRYTPEEDFEPGRWWRTTTDSLAVFREVFGILNIWAGLPVAPRER